MSVTAIPFTTREEIEQLFGTSAVDLRIDDVADQEAADALMAAFVDDATGIVWQYLWTRYAEADANASTWVRQRATWVGAYLISCRRGNPAQYIDRYQQILEELQKIFDGTMFIPGLQVLVAQQPTLSNFTLDNRSVAPVTRVLPSASVGTYPGQRTTNSAPYPEVF